MYTTLNFYFSFAKFLQRALLFCVCIHTFHVLLFNANPVKFLCVLKLCVLNIIVLLYPRCKHPRASIYNAGLEVGPILTNNFKKYFTKMPYYVIVMTWTLLIYNLKLKLFILITMADFAEFLTDFSYTNFSVGLSNVDALDRLRVHLNIILFLMR